jgi:hypothetical protein
MTPRNSVWTGTALDVYGDVPAAEFTAYPQGQVKLWVVGQDEAGNWGTPVSHTLQLDETAPIVLPGSSVPAASVLRGASCPAGQSPCGGTLVFTGQDPLLPVPAPAGWQPFSSGIVAVEWQVGFPNSVDLATWTGNAIVTDVSATPGVPGGPVTITMPFSGGPTPYAAGAEIVFRVRDAAGNFSAFYYTSIPV